MDSEKSRSGGRNLSKSVPTQQADLVRFASHINKIRGGCWIWTGALTANGYGRFGIDYDVYLAHRVAYVLVHGDHSDDLVIDHKCRNKACVNPDHLEAVTFTENIRRGVAYENTKARYAARTHCKNGHKFTDETLRFSMSDKRPQRYCLICEREKQARYSAERRANREPRTHCKNGHPVAPDENDCTTCNDIRQAAYRAKMRLKNPRPPLPPRTHCRNGHAVVEGEAECKICMDTRQAAYRARKRLAKASDSATVV